MKKTLLFAVALLSISQGAFANPEGLVPRTGEIDPWKNGAVPASAILCSEVGSKNLPSVDHSAGSRSSAVSRSAGSSSAR